MAARRGIKSQVEARLIESEAQLRAGKSIFFRVTEGALSFNTLRSYIYDLWNSRRIGDPTLPYITTKEVLYQGQRAVEAIPRSTTISAHDAHFGGMPFDAAAAAAAQVAMTTMGLDPQVANRRAWLTTCTAEAIDMVALIAEAGGMIPHYSPGSPEGQALVTKLKGGEP